MLGGEEGKTKQKRRRKAAPEGSPPVMADAKQGPARYVRRYRGVTEGGGPGEAPLRLRQTASASERGNPRKRRSRPAGEAETWSVPAAPAISRPARLPPSLLPGGGSLIFRGVSRVRRPEATRTRAGTACLLLLEQPGQRGRSFPRHGGVPGPPSPASKGELAAELRGTRYRLVDDGRFLGASPPVFTSDLGTSHRGAPSLSVGHPRHRVLPTPR